MTSVTKKTIVSIFCLLAVKVASSQTQVQSNCLVITYEHYYSKSFEPIERNFWIAPCDSIKSKGFTIYPLFLSGYYESHLDSCCKGIAVDPGGSRPTSQNTLDSTEETALEALKKLIFRERRKVETISKAWLSGRQERITIYVTPVKGQFCFSEFGPIGRLRSNYTGKISIPRNGFNSYNEFWNSDRAKIVLTQDFAERNFGYNILYNTLFP